MAKEILIVDDEADIRDLLAGLLEDEGYQPKSVSGDEDCFAALNDRQPDLIILDVWLKGSSLDGIEILRQIKHDYPDQQVIMISGHATIDVAMQALRIGAYDFITKPFKSAQLFHTISKALEVAKLNKENSRLKNLSIDEIGYESLQQDGQAQIGALFAGESSFSQDIRKNIKMLAGNNGRLFLSGPRGVGKTLAARIIHQQSKRGQDPFIVFNCGRDFEHKSEVALFGREADGHSPRIIGAIEQAHKGTLYFDEIQVMEKEVQSKLLKAILQGEFKRVGGQVAISYDVRFMASAPYRLKEIADEFGFSSDLLSRLSVQQLHLLPFSQRLEDIALIGDSMLKQACQRKNRSLMRFSGEARKFLMRHNWPHNGWELRQLIERLIALSDISRQVIDGDMVRQNMGGFQISDNDLETNNIPINPPINSDDKPNWQEIYNLPLKEAREIFEAHYLDYHININQGNISKTAETIGMDRAALHRKLKSLSLHRLKDEN